MGPSGDRVDDGSDDDSPFGTDSSLVETTYSLEPTDTGPEGPDWLEEAREAVAVEHDN